MIKGMGMHRLLDRRWLYYMNPVASGMLVHALRWACVDWAWVLLHALGGVGYVDSFGVGYL